MQKICAETNYQNAFGSVLRAWYAEDLIDEDIIKEWNDLPETKGAEGSSMDKLWKIGKSMLVALEQDSDEESSSEEDSDEEEEQTKSLAAAVSSSQNAGTASEESDEEEDSDTEEDSDEE
jgi:hypothetical protein